MLKNSVNTANVDVARTLMQQPVVDRCVSSYLGVKMSLLITLFKKSWLIDYVRQAVSCSLKRGFVNFINLSNFCNCRILLNSFAEKKKTL